MTRQSSPSGFRASTEFIVIHTSATRYGVSINKNDFYRWHVLDNGWSHVGYCYVIFPDGTVWNVHGDDRLYGNHVKKYNGRALGICLVGGLDRATGKPDNQYTSMQMIALKELVSDLLKKYPDAKVTGHRTLSPDKDGDGIIEKHEFLKECPCFNAPSWARYYGFPAYGNEQTEEWKPKHNGLPDDTPHVVPVWSNDISLRNGQWFDVFKNGIHTFTAASEWSADAACEVLNNYESALQNYKEKALQGKTET
jgi:N-acetylmuramoyl-L-alanine amidase